jgi:hypothetical protein
MENARVLARDVGDAYLLLLALAEEHEKDRAEENIVRSGVELIPSEVSDRSNWRPLAAAVPKSIGEEMLWKVSSNPILAQQVMEMMATRNEQHPGEDFVFNAPEDVLAAFAKNATKKSN